MQDANQAGSQTDIQSSSTVILVGTGVAPLIAARLLISRGVDVILANPDHDFFSENSELPFDPLWPWENSVFSANRLKESFPENAVEEMRSVYPGSVGYWKAGQSEKHDPREEYSPFVRSRTRVWVETPRFSDPVKREALDNLYLEASELGMNPLLHEDLAAAARFPGLVSQIRSDARFFTGIRAVSLSKLCDVDVSRFRQGMLEFVMEKVASNRVLLNVHDIHLSPQGLIRISLPQDTVTVPSGVEVVFFMTTRLMRWLLAREPLLSLLPRTPQAVQLWEEWSVLSKESLDPDYIGVYDEMSIWPQFEGTPGGRPTGIKKLNVLRAAPRLGLDWLKSTELELVWASSESFHSLSKLCFEFLRWNRFSIREMKPRYLLHWDAATPLQDRPREGMRWVYHCEGPLTRIIHNVRQCFAEGA